MVTSSLRRPSLAHPHRPAPLLLAALLRAAPDPLLPTSPTGPAARVAREAGVQLERLDLRLGADAEGLSLSWRATRPPRPPPGRRTAAIP